MDYSSIHWVHFPHAAGLVVDWINDKVYWADKVLKAIYMYDLNSKGTSMVRDIPDSNPTKLKIFPQLHGRQACLTLAVLCVVLYSFMQLPVHGRS